MDTSGISPVAAYRRDYTLNLLSIPGQFGDQATLIFSETVAFLNLGLMFFICWLLLFYEGRARVSVYCAI